MQSIKACGGEGDTYTQMLSLLAGHREGIFCRRNKPQPFINVNNFFWIILCASSTYHSHFMDSSIKSTNNCQPYNVKRKQLLLK